MLQGWRRAGPLREAWRREGRALDGLYTRRQLATSAPCLLCQLGSGVRASSVSAVPQQRKKERWKFACIVLFSPSLQALQQDMGCPARCRRWVPRRRAAASEALLPNQKRALLSMARLLSSRPAFHLTPRDRRFDKAAWLQCSLHSGGSQAQLPVDPRWRCSAGMSSRGRAAG